MVDTPNPKVIVALDFEGEKQALELVERLDPRLCRLKVGMTLHTKLGAPFVQLLQHKGFEVFLDLKFHDIPMQVKGACQQAAALGCWMINVHALGGEAMLRAAKEAVQASAKPPLLIGVTVLTSMASDDLAGVGIEQPVSSVVMSLAGLCKKAGLDGVVCSAHEARMIKQEYGPEFLTITPGIRLESDSNDDQKRVMTPSQAFAQGADYLVMGRSIAAHPEPIKCLQGLVH